MSALISVFIAGIRSAIDRILAISISAASTGATRTLFTDLAIVFRTIQRIINRTTALSGRCITRIRRTHIVRILSTLGIISARPVTRARLASSITKGLSTWALALPILWIASLSTRTRHHHPHTRSTRTMIRCTAVIVTTAQIIVIRVFALTRRGITALVFTVFICAVTRLRAVAAALHTHTVAQAPAIRTAA